MIDGSVENQQLVRLALRILPERAIDELGPDEDLREWAVVRVNDEITVDLMTAACGMTFAEAREAFILRANWRLGDSFCQPRPDDSIKARKPGKRSH